MYPHKIFSLVSVSILLLSSCQNETPSSHIDVLDTQVYEAIQTQSKTGNLDYFILPESDDFARIPQDPRNPITQEKVALGAFLFHDPSIGVDAKNPDMKNSFSCASCHHADAGFQAGTFQGIGEGGIGFGSRGELRQASPIITNHDAQPIRTPTAMNGAYQPNMLWNGQFGATHLNENTKHLWPENTPIATNKLGYQGLEIQAIAGMTVHRMNINEEVLQNPSYKKLFDEVFADFPEDRRYTKETAGLAMAAYERTILSNRAPFQEYLKGNTRAMTEQEKRGAIVFFQKANCTSCHTGPSLSSMQFNAIGMGDLVQCPEPTLFTKLNDPTDKGRGGFTKNPNDNYKFKVPQLYNLTDSPFYGHGASFRSIRQVLEYKNRAIAENPNVPQSALDPFFTPQGLTNDEIRDLEAFISRALYDPNLKRYVPVQVPSGLCFPNADERSKLDMNCQ